jgi:lysophospholipase L1-like esterase
MGHVVLLGDSIFDNAAYIAGGPDVITQLQQGLPHGWKATLRAVDGSLTAGVHNQLYRLPEEASHLIISAGGNDALGHLSILNESVCSTAETLERLAGIAEQFERRYSSMLEAVLRQGLPTVVCTIYYPNFPDRAFQRIAVTALTVFNDVILRQACMAGVAVLDLRLICSSPADYANPIEPSVRGREKIAAGIVQILKEHDFQRRRTALFIGA